MNHPLEKNTAPAPGWRDYLAIASRRRWALLGPLFLCGFAGFTAARFWPFLYRSEALILVEQQRVPEQYVTPNVITNLQTRLESITQQIRSRTRLQRLIQDFNLYARDRSRMTMDEVIDRMRGEIEVQLVQTPGRQGDLAGFRVYYSADSPQIAQRITNELTSMFIEENLRSRTQQSVGTTNFLESELEQARNGLAEQEAREREFKLRYLGQLPAQQQGNLQILSSLEAQLRASDAALDRADQQRVYMESMRAQYQSMLKAASSRESSLAGQESGKSRPAAAAEAAVEQLRRQLTELRIRYTAKHPDIAKFEELIAQWEATIARLEAEPPAGRGEEPDAAASGDRTEPGLMEIESRLKAVALEISAHEKVAEMLRERIKQYQSRLDLTPVREQQLSEVSRTTENARAHYQSLLQKKLQSELASNLEKRQQGEQFRILDPATLPTKPEGRLRLILLGWVAGTIVGIGLAFARHATDDSVRDERDAGPAARLAVLATIPVLRSPGRCFRDRWSRRMDAAAIVMLTMLSAATGVYTYLME